MWSLLDNALQKIKTKPLAEQIAIRTTIRRFLKVYCFIIQATAYENISLHKRYIICLILLKKLMSVAVEMILILQTRLQ